MSNKHLECFVDKVRNMLKERNIPILCKAYDGQWHKFITEDRKGNSLTKLHDHDNWNKVVSMSKDKCIEEIALFSLVKRSMHEQVNTKEMEKGAKINVQEIHIEKDIMSRLHVSSSKGKMPHIRSVHPVSRPDLYIRTQICDETEIKKNSVVIEEEKYVLNKHGFKLKWSLKFMYTSIFDANNCAVKKAESKRNRLIGLQDTKSNLLDAINPLKEQNAEIENNELDDDGPEDVGNVNQQMLTLDEYLKSDQSVILPNILNELKNSNTEKWMTKSVETYFLHC